MCARTRVRLCVRACVCVCVCYCGFVKHPVRIPRAILTGNLCRARKGVAPGPSGLTSEALRLILDDEAVTNQFVQVSQLLAQGSVPQAAARLLGLGRVVALQTLNGGTISRSLAQQFASQLQSASRPWQFALST